ncbi:signal peptidase II [Lyticum sinuosum]|uniref:Lipoprotein signal peptidase n=1 Tax=Lyticum sinuosum TaxID=1332059 RepID=A0AAE5AHT9_9RICK|nr:signal peptidase II [Lyticum sinuosum]MDZ5761553.1 Lipoprotein signal peptidase [Lyticum sinuosum]
MKDLKKDSIKIYIKMFLIGIIILFLDQITKFYVISYFHSIKYNSDRSKLININNFFNITEIHNYGISFSMLDSFPKEILIILSLCLIILMIIWIIKNYFNNKSIYFLNLIIWGAIGNLTDRIKYGYVIDFIDIHIKNIHYPVFNIADICICIGAILFTFYELKNTSLSNKSI